MENHTLEEKRYPILTGDIGGTNGRLRIVRMSSVIYKENLLINYIILEICR